MTSKPVSKTDLDLKSLDIAKAQSEGVPGSMTERPPVHPKRTEVPMKGKDRVHERSLTVHDPNAFFAKAAAQIKIPIGDKKA
jgi:hypothetical protein